MICVGEKVRITEGRACGEIAEVVESDPRFLELKMNGGEHSLFPLWRVTPLGQRNRVREATTRRVKRWKERGGGAL